MPSFNSPQSETGAEPDPSTVHSSTSAGRKPRGKSFQPGNRHGKGRPPGSRNKLTILFQDTLDEYGPHILRKTLKMAMEGDRTALKLAVERLLPPVQGSRIALRLPPVRSTADLSAASAKVIQAVTRGDITLEEGRALTEMLDAHRRVLEADEVASRIAALLADVAGISKWWPSGIICGHRDAFRRENAQAVPRSKRQVLRGPANCRIRALPRRSESTLRENPGQPCGPAGYGEHCHPSPFDLQASTHRLRRILPEFRGVSY